jgi:hypothetical protein
MGEGKQVVRNLQDLPFIKRYQYRDEKEFRLVCLTEDDGAKTLQIELESVKQIVLSPWLPLPLQEAVTDTIKSIDGCKNISVYRSGLLQNEQWLRYAKRLEAQPDCKLLSVD